MKTKHWEIKIQPDEVGLQTTINEGIKRIATIKFNGIDETEANAKLIAAAPELLNTLKKVDDFLYRENIVKSNHTTEHFKLIQSIRESIKKATE